MGLRREARKLAVRVLYCIEVAGVSEEAACEILGNEKCSGKCREFAGSLVKGTLENLEFLDELILKYAKNWEMDRMANVDKIIIRLGIYEIFFQDSIPRNVSINEAIELAKYFSTAKSHKFVNGMLDSISREMDRV